jgi:hypothetical protein
MYGNVELWEYEVVRMSPFKKERRDGTFQPLLEAPQAWFPKQQEENVSSNHYHNTGPKGSMGQTARYLPIYWLGIASSHTKYVSVSKPGQS